MFLLKNAGLHETRHAIFDAGSGERLSYAELRSRVAEVASHLAGETQKRLVFLFCRNDEPTVLAYLAAITAGHAVALLDASLARELSVTLLERYRPDIVCGAAEDLPGYRRRDPVPHVGSLLRRDGPQDVAPHTDLALLLSTSGSTGSPKFVRLSRRAVEHNARAITKALQLTADERPVTSLPLYYSFGLSILNSHLMTGAEVVLTGESLVSEDFWTAIKDRKCTSLAGVPYSYEMLDRLDLIKLAPDCLKTLTQAGGKLANELIVKFHEFMENRGGRFFVMYGQTEATARISVLPPDRLPEKLDSVGLPLEGGRLEVWKDDRPLRQPNAVGEVVYHGDNVMLGYARAREDIGAGDELGGKLRTGDLGYLDDDGFLHISGRVKRIAKVFGLRINLEELESMLRPNGLTAAIAVQDRVILFSEFRSDDGYHDLRRSLAQRLGIHHSGFVFRHIEKLPLTATGKINYRLLETELL